VNERRNPTRLRFTVFSRGDDSGSAAALEQIGVKTPWHKLHRGLLRLLALSQLFPNSTLDPANPVESRLAPDLS
jgi:hypothetical protein